MHLKCNWFGFCCRQNLQYKISRRHLVDIVKRLQQKACCTCSMIIFKNSTNQIIDLWRCRSRCRRISLTPYWWTKTETQRPRWWTKTSLRGLNSILCKYLFLFKINQYGRWSGEWKSSIMKTPLLRPQVNEDSAIRLIKEAKCFLLSIY